MNIPRVSQEDQNPSLPNTIWKVGVIGCGKIAGGHDLPSARGAATTHAQAFDRHPQFALDSAVDSDQEQLERFRKLWGLSRGFSSASEMLEQSSPDVVVVCSPDSYHFENAKELLWAVNSPKLILMEKPICETSQQLSELQRLGDQTGTSIIVNHTRRFDAAHQTIADDVRKGAFGSLLSGYWTYYGGWAHNGSHVLDTLRMLLGDNIVVVDSTRSFGEKSNDPDLTVSLQIGRARVTIEPFSQQYYQVFESRLLFEHGVIRVNDFGNQIVVEITDVNHLGERVLIPRDDSPFEGLTSPMSSVVDSVASILSGHASESYFGVDLDSAAKTMNVIWKAQSMALGHNNVAKAHLQPSSLET